MLESESATYEKGRCVRKQVESDQISGCGYFTFFRKNPSTRRDDKNVERIHFEEGHPCYKKEHALLDIHCNPYVDFETGKGIGKPVSEIGPNFYDKERGGVCFGMFYAADMCAHLASRNGNRLTPECKVLLKQLDQKNDIEKSAWDIKIWPEAKKLWLKTGLVEEEN
jgi:hypothetical protein